MNDDGDPFLSGGTLAGNLVPTAFTFGGADDWTVRIYFDPPRVEVNTGIDWDAAAKHFWNAVAKMAGQPPPFGW